MAFPRKVRNRLCPETDRGWRGIGPRAKQWCLNYNNIAIGSSFGFKSVKPFLLRFKRVKPALPGFMVAILILFGFRRSGPFLTF